MGAKGVRRAKTLLAGIGTLVLVLLVGAGGGLAEGDAPAWISSTVGLEALGVSSLAIHPKRPDILYAHVHGLGVARSFDGGQNWEVMHEGLDPRHVPGPRDHVEFGLDERDAKTLWLVTKGHVYKSENGGEKWEDMTTGALVSYSWDKRDSAYDIRGVVIDPKKSLHVLAGTRTEGRMRGGLYESTDGGKSWEQIAGDDLPKSELGHDAWPIVLDPKTDKNILVGGSSGVWFSDDRGREFKRVDPGDLGEHEVRHITPMMGRRKDVYIADGRGLWRSRDGGKRWDKKPLRAGDCVAIGRAPWSKSLLLAVFRDQGVVRSDDGGRKWKDIGLADEDIHQILAHPREKNVIYFASPQTGLYVSKDAGVTIESVRGNLKPVVPAIIAAAAHPASPGHLLAMGQGGNVWHSKDDGKTWAWAGRLAMRPTQILPDASREGVWYATGNALEVTEDHGMTWKTLWRPAEPEERITAFVRLEDGTLALLLERSRRMVTSADGKSWTIVKGPGKSAEIWARDLAVDPLNPKHILMATRRRSNLWTSKETEGGPYETWDGGHAWKLLAEGLTKGRDRLRNWNRGAWVSIVPGAGLQFYGADGLGLFARQLVSPKDKPEHAPRWVDLGLPLPKARIRSSVVIPGDGEAPVTLVLQIEGKNDARAIVRTSLDKVRERVKIVEAGEGVPEESIWETLPDAGASLVSLAVDPFTPGRLIGADRDGTKGVLFFGVPGARAAAGDDADGAAAPSEANAGSTPPKGLLAFSGGSDAGVRIWDLAEGKAVGSLKGHTGEVFALALAPDESVVVTGGADKSIRVFNAATGEETAVLDPSTYKAAVNAIAFGPTSDQVFLGLDQSWTVVSWNLASKKCRSFEGHTGAVLCLAVSDDGARLVSGSRDRTLRCWDVGSGASTCRLDFGAEVFAVALSPDGGTVYAGGSGAAVKVFDVASGKQVAGVDLQGEHVSDLTLSEDGTILYVAGDQGLKVVHAADLTPLDAPAGGRYEGPTHGLLSIALSKDGQWIVGGGPDSTLWLWRTDQAKPWWSAPSAHAGAVQAVALTPDVGDLMPADGG